MLYEVITRGDHPRHTVHDAVDRGVQLLPHHGTDDHPAGAAERHSHSLHSLRQYTRTQDARSLADA